MSLSKPSVVIFWFKRDLRLTDNPALAYAISLGLPFLPIYIFEPGLQSHPEYSERHFRFISESMSEIQSSFSKYGAVLLQMEMSAQDCFLILHEAFDVKMVVSHQETGNLWTFNRDKEISAFFKERGISWTQIPQMGIQRGRLYNGESWVKRFHDEMNEAIEPIDLDRLIPIAIPSQIKETRLKRHSPTSQVVSNSFQIGGESRAHSLLHSFVYGRANGYMKSISKPLASREKCSRLSPYLAWGNISPRQAYQAQKEKSVHVDYKWDLKNFAERLRWRSHFIQKLENDTTIEHRYGSDKYYQIRQDWNQEWFNAWKNGETGFPLVDACMRCLQATGYLNFRMRSMLVSFLTHHLWLDWKEGAHHLARLFLDFEPGIHFSQFQMESGTSGVHTVRVYNPVKQGLDHDADGTFVRQWVPELKEVPTPFIHQPWKLTAMEQAFIGLELGKNYPKPIVNHEETYQKATDILWKMKNSKNGESVGKPNNLES